MGLMGFIRIFFFVFLLALFGWVTLGIPWNVQNRIDLSVKTLIEQTPNIFETMARGPEYYLGTTLSTFNTFIFVGFLSLFFYSLATLYFLFLVTNSLTLPIKGALLSIPVVIETTSIENAHDSTGLLHRVTAQLRNAKALRGMVLAELTLGAENDGNRVCKVAVIEDFTNISELTNRAISILNELFSISEIAEVHITFFRESLARLENLKLLDVRLTKKEYGFVVKKTQGMDTIYKLRQLGANYYHYHLPESQIL